MTWLQTIFKYLLSFRKAEWTLGDYPVRLLQQATSVETPAVRPWCAQIVNWWLMVGFGDTPEAALEDLRARLEAKRARGDTLPRPGTKAPGEFAPGNELGRHGDFAYDFVERTVGVRPQFMSDSTSLADFCTADEALEVHRKTTLLFGVDTREMLDDPSWKVLDLVQETTPANSKTEP